MSQTDQALAEVTVFRFNPATDQEPRYVRYEVPFQPSESILYALEYIREHLDATFSFRMSCNSGHCTACINRVNGNPVKVCRTPMQARMVIEPVAARKVLRDLVVSG